jgi:hypothetical protein
MTVDRSNIDVLKLSLKPVADSQIITCTTVFFLLGAAILYLQPSIHPVIFYFPFILGIQLLIAHFLLYKANQNRE